MTVVDTTIWIPWYSGPEGHRQTGLIFSKRRFTFRFPSYDPGSWGSDLGVPGLNLESQSRDGRKGHILLSPTHTQK